MKNLRLVVILLACMSIAGIAAFAAHRTNSHKTHAAAKHSQKAVAKHELKRPSWLKDEDEGKGGPEADDPEKAIEWRHLAWKDDQGNIPPDGLNKALAARQQQLMAQANGSSGGGFTPSWTYVGPNNIGGRTNTMAINPTNTAVILAGAAGGGVWRSNDSGAHWAPLSDTWAPLAMGSIVFDPNNSNIVYAGTGEASLNVDAIAGGGIYKSTDGGSTFSLMTSTANFQAVGEISVEPGNSNVILVGTRYGGLQRTTDGGATWTNVIAAQGCYNVRFSTANANNAMCSIVDYNSGWFNYLAYSTDGGATWTTSSGATDTGNSIYGRYQFSYAPSNNSIVYASKGTNSGPVVFYKSTDGGHSFASVSSPNFGTTQLWYDNALWVDPTNANNLVHGALDIWKSTDGGATWNQIALWSNHYGNDNLPHADDHVIINDPNYNGTTNKIVYVGNDGGMYKATDITAAGLSSGWTGLNIGYDTAQFYGVSGDATSGTFLGGLQDNGTVQTATGSPTGSEEFGGDGGFAAVDPTNANFLFGEYVYARMHRSTDHGANSSYIYTSGLSDASSGNANFISPFILSPHSHTTLLVGAYGLWRTVNADDASVTWSKIKNGGTNYISAVAEAPTDANTLWVGQNDGAMAATSNGTAASPSWTTITSPAARYVGRITFDPTNAHTIYVGFGGYGTPNLYKSTDSGATWSTLVGSGSTALPQAPIRGIAVDPLNPQQIFVGTEVGLYYTTNGGVSWSTNAFGPNSASVDEVVFVQNSHTLLVGTHGRGMWSTPVPAAAAVSAVSSSPTTVVAGNPTVGTVTLTSNAPAGGQLVNLSSSDISAVTVLSTVTVPAGSNSTTFPITTHGVDVSKSSIVTASAGGGTASVKVTVIPATLAYIVSAPASVVAGYKPNLDLQLNGAAGPTPITVNLTTSNSSVASIPTTATFPAFTHLITVPITTFGVDTAQAVTLKAQQGTGPLRSCSLTVNPAGMKSLTAQPSPVYGGQASTLFVYLAGPAGPSGVTVTLSSDNSAVASVQGSVTIAGGSSSTTVPISTVGVDTQKAIPLRAHIGTGTTVVSNALVVNPASVYLAVVSPASVKGGTRTNFVVYLLGSPGPSGVTVNLTSDNQTLAPVPATLFFPAGTTRQSISVLTKVVTASTTFNLNARIGTVTKSAALTITP